MKSGSEAVIHLGDIVVDCNLNLVVRNGHSRRMEPKHIAVLELLVQKSGQVLLREELASKVWPGVVVNTDSLNRAIFALRNALGDDAKEPKYIETIPRKGYRFVYRGKLEGSVSEQSVEPKIKRDVSAQPQTLCQNKDESKVYVFKWYYLLAVLLVVLAVILAALFGHFDVGQKRLYSSYDLGPLTQRKGAEIDLAVSNSNSSLLYVHRHNGQDDLFLRDLHTQNEQRLTNDEWQQHSPVWLSEDTWMFIRCKNKVCQLLRQGTLEKAKVLYQSKGRLYDIAYNEKAEHKVLLTEFVHPGKIQLLSLDLVTHRVLALSSFYDGLPDWLRSPLYSEDGALLYFYTKSGEQGRLVSFDFRSGEIKKSGIIFDEISDISLAESAQGIFVAASRAQVFGIWRLSAILSDAKLIFQSSGEEIFQSLQYNQAEDQLYYASVNSAKDLALLSLISGALKPLELLNSRAAETVAVFDANEEKLYYVSSQSGYSELWEYNFESQETVQLTSIKASDINAMSLAPDGTLIAISYIDEDAKLALINSTSGSLVKSRSIPHEVFPLAWSADKKKLYISEHRKQINLYEVDIETQNRKDLSTNSGLFVHVNEPGQGLFFVDYELQALTSFNGSKPRRKVSGQISNLTSLMPGSVAIIDGQLLTLSVAGLEADLHQGGSQVIVNSLPVSFDAGLDASGDHLRQPVHHRVLESVHDIAAVVAISEAGEFALVALREPSSGAIMKLRFHL